MLREARTAQRISPAVASRKEAMKERGRNVKFHQLHELSGWRVVPVLFEVQVTK